MLDCSYSPLKPTSKSPAFYQYFFNQYSFIQVNDLCVRYAIEGLSDYEKKEAIFTALLLEGQDYDRNSVFLKCMGLLDPSLEKRKQEDRGFSQELISVFSQLSENKKDPLEWVLITNEFLMVYAVWERTLFEALSEDFISEKKLFARFTQFLEQQGKLRQYKQLINKTSGDCFTSLEDITAVWGYYTLLRHCIAHSAGFWTQGFLDRFSELDHGRLKNIEKRLWNHPVYLGTYDPEENPFFRNYEAGKIIEISNPQMNLFRNTALRTVEGLNCIFSDVKNSEEAIA